MTQDITPSPTLGELLDAEGRRLAARLDVRLPWAGPLRLLMDRTTAPAAGTGRFARVDVPPGSPWPPATVVPLPLRRPDVRSETAEGAPGPAAEGGTRRPPGRAPAPPGPTVPPATAARPAAEAKDPLPAGTRSRLREAVGPAADALRAHHDTPADDLARSRRADAVTVGRDVYFRHGRLRPHDARGYGLLVHEATHVLALLRPGASWLRATGAGARAEEAEALRNEQAARAGAAVSPPAAERSILPPAGPPVPLPPFAPPPAGTSSAARPLPSAAWSPPSASSPSGPAGTPPAGAPAPAPTPGPGPGPGPGPHTTAGDLTTATSPAARPQHAAADRDASPAAGPPGLDVAALRHDLINDLMRRLRSESERGG